MNVILVDTGALLATAWRHQLADCVLGTGVEVQNSKLGDIKVVMKNNKNNSAIVSPANSIGCMSGGFDLSICKLLVAEKQTDEDGIHPLERHVKQAIQCKYNSYLPLTTPVLVDCSTLKSFEKSAGWKRLRARYVVACPAMRVPKKLYLAKTARNDEAKREIVRFIFDYVWNCFHAIDVHNRSDAAVFQGTISTTIMPGVGTGYGGLPVDLVAKGMIGALGLYFVNNFSGIEKGILALKFLGEDYTLYDNSDLKDVNEKLSGWDFDILKQNVSDFFSQLESYEQDR